MTCYQLHGSAVGTAAVGCGCATDWLSRSLIKSAVSSWVSLAAMYPHYSVVVIVVLTWNGSAGACYVFPPDMVDPCRDKRCSFGAQCVPSLDGLTARCQCPQRCDNYGDSVGSTPICGTDGRDYDNTCQMRRAACSEMRDIEKKYDGKCGTYSIYAEKEWGRWSSCLCNSLSSVMHTAHVGLRR